MSKAVSVYHGAFGRASLYHLDKPMTRHAHPEAHLIFHVRGPDQHFNALSERLPLGRADAVALNPWEPHDYAPEPGEGQLMLVLYIKPTWFANLPWSGSSLRFQSHQLDVTPRIDRCVSRIVALLLTGAPASLFDGYVFEMTELCLERSRQRTSDVAAQSATMSACDYRIRKSLRLLEGFPSDISFDKVACESGLSRPHFFKLFRDQLGLTPKLFWNSLRMERAIAALTASPKSVNEISFDLGFTSPFSFSRCFASNVGIAPSEYRRAAQTLQ